MGNKRVGTLSDGVIFRDTLLNGITETRRGVRVRVHKRYGSMGQSYCGAVPDLEGRKYTSQNGPKYTQLRGKITSFCADCMKTPFWDLGFLGIRDISDDRSIERWSEIISIGRDHGDIDRLRPFLERVIYGVSGMCTL